MPWIFIIHFANNFRYAFYSAMWALALCYSSYPVFRPTNGNYSSQAVSVCDHIAKLCCSSPTTIKPNSESFSLNAFSLIRLRFVVHDITMHRHSTSPISDKRERFRHGDQRIRHTEFVLVCVERIHAARMWPVAALIVRPYRWFCVVVLHINSGLIVHSQFGRIPHGRTHGNAN